MNYVSRRKRAPMGLRESEAIRSPGHLAWTRGNTCIVAGLNNHVCQGRSEAHHVKGFMDGGMSRKPGDDKVVSVCSGAHMEIHNDGAETFEKRYKISLTGKAEANWKASPHRIKYEQRLSPLPT